MDKAEDVRYTRSGSIINANFLGMPEGGQEILLNAFSSENAGEHFEISRISIPGSDEQVSWELDDAGLQAQPAFTDYRRKHPPRILRMKNLIK